MRQVRHRPDLRGSCSFSPNPPLARRPSPAARPPLAGRLSRALRIPVPDVVAGLLLHGYRYLPGLRRRSPDGVATTRVAGRRAVVAAGPDAVRAFYDDERFARAGTLPGQLEHSLIGHGSFGRGSVHGLDDAAHRHRKELFGTLLAPDRVAGLADRIDHEWSEAVRRWRGVDRIVVFDEAVLALGRGALAWAGIRARPRQLDERVRDLALIVDGAGGVGTRHVRARLARRRCEGWARVAVRHARSGRLPSGVGADSPVALVSTHRDADGRLLDERTAAVELLNLLRPTVAVAWLVTFAVAALAERPEWRPRLADGTDAERSAFVDEVRRVYPSVPALVARARHDQVWRGRRLPAGSLFVLDVYGTDTDPAVWRCPHDLDPDRFLAGGDFLPGGGADRDALVPQGGGDARTGHRCPGEAATIELTGRAARLFAGLTYRLPPQDLRISKRRMPTRPASGVVLARVRQE